MFAIYWFLFKTFILHLVNFIKTRIFVGSMPKSLSFLRKYILIPLQNLKAIGAVSIELSRKQILTTYTQTNTHTDTHTCIFGRRLFFQCRSYMYKKKVEIWQLIFDPDSRLYSIKDWESKKKIPEKLHRQHIDAHNIQ